MKHIFKLICVSCFYLLSFGVNAQNLFSSKYSVDELGKKLIPIQNWKPFPIITDREGWAKADQQTMKSIFGEAEKMLSYEWPSLSATTTLLFVRTGDRNEYQNILFKKRSVLATLVLAEVYENKGRFLDQIVNGIWSICEESYWGVPAHLNQWHAGAGLPDVSDPYVDLFAAETVSLLSWVDFLVGEKLNSISPQIRKRIYFESNKRIFTPVMTQEHPWMGLNHIGRRPNNWNPWICSNWLCAALLLEKDSVRRNAMVEKILTVLDQFLNPYPADGGCDEGPGYWNAAGASLFDNIAMLNMASDNAFKYVLADEKVKNIGKFVYRAQISGKYFLNFADASPKPGMNGCLIWRFGKAINDKEMQKFGAFFRSAPDGKLSYGMFFRLLFELFVHDEFNSAPTAMPLPKEVWFPNIQVMIARDKDGSTDGFFVGAKGGNNDESHNHNDVGSFVVYYNGLPLLIDVGSGTYTARTFSPQRYDIWFNCSDYHNLPIINGKTQLPGPEFKATDVSYKGDQNFAQLSLNITHCYPADAGIDSWLRSIKLNRGNNVEITEEVKLHNPGRFSETLMTCYPAEVVSPGKLVIHYAPSGEKAIDFMIIYNAAQFKADIEKIESRCVEDKSLLKVWENSIYRLNLKTVKEKTNGKYPFQISIKK